MTLTDLQSIIDSLPESPQAWQRKPFTISPHTYATDGRIMVRVPEIHGADIIDARTTVNVAYLFRDPVDLSREIQVADITVDAPMETCGRCDGDGKYECGTCGHEHDPCPECAGRGEKVPGSTRIKIGGAEFLFRYVRILKTLAGCSIVVNGMDPAAFRFDGGDGLLGPVRPQ